MNAAPSTPIVRRFVARMNHAVTAYDRRREGKRGYNVYALPQYLAAIDRAAAFVAHGEKPESALARHFNDPLLSACLKEWAKSGVARGPEDMPEKDSASFAGLCALSFPGARQSDSGRYFIGRAIEATD